MKTEEEIKRRLTTLKTMNVENIFKDNTDLDYRLKSEIKLLEWVLQ